MKILILTVLALSAASGALAADKAAEAAPASSDASADAMKAWQDFATPGEHHKLLGRYVGSWKTHTRMWFKPDAPAQESDGRAEIRWALGNRYIEQRQEGQMLGRPFSGIGYTGFDNVKQKYVTIWMDTAGTSILYELGSVDPSGRVIKSRGTVDDPVTKKPQRYQDAVTFRSPDSFSYEAWGPEPGGVKMFRMMEIVYTRQK